MEMNAEKDRYPYGNANGPKGPETTGERSATVLLVDGMATLFRAYYATAGSGDVVRTRTGVPVNGIHGFLRLLGAAVSAFRPTHVACCWDREEATFRAAQYPGYKAHRPETPPDLVPQFGLIREVLDRFGIPNVSAAGYEADDCLGTLARRFRKEAAVYVLTGDRDLLQLVDERVRVVLFQNGFVRFKVYTPALVLEETGIRPDQLTDLKGLMGDRSDNYPGVAGIGAKTAVRLLREYGSVDGILANLDQLSPSLRRKIEADLDMLHLSRRLATLDCAAPIGLKLADCRWQADRARVTDVCEALGFRDRLRWIG
jgi:5'-3' exonuclease